MEETMMPVLRVNDATFSNLSMLRTWYQTKTPSETIDCAVREVMEQLEIEKDDEPDEAAEVTSTGPMEFKTAPGLTFTKPLSASVDGKSVKSPRWSSVLVAMIAQVKANGLEGEKLVSELAIPAKAERYEKAGYRYRSNLGISIQGQSAPDAWQEIDRLATRWNIPVKVEFWWRKNPKAQHPGRTGVLKSGGA